MSKLTWQRLATGDLLCNEYPIRLVKPLDRRAESPGWVFRVPASEDSSYADRDGWQWTNILDQDTRQLEDTSARDAKARLESTVYREYILGWIPREYGEWTAERQQAFVDEAQATADKVDTWRAKSFGDQPKRQPRAKVTRPAQTDDPYEAIGLHRPNANGWPATIQLSSVHFEALMQISGKVADRLPSEIPPVDVSEYTRPLREIHAMLTNLDPRGR